MKLCQYLDVSMAHLPEADAERLMDDEINGYPYRRDCWFGSFVWTREDPEELLTQEYSPAIVRILHMAKRAGADLIRFDTDGTVHPELPTY